MSKYDSIRFFNDEEVNAQIQNIAPHPMFKSLLRFTFPEITEEETKQLLSSIHSIQEFHEKFITKTMERIVATTSDGVSLLGFEHLDNSKSYLYISNHRDILLDSSLLNVNLMKHGQIMTASAIGDNLVQKSFLMDLAKLNRNFIVKRKASPRELLLNSQLLSEYISDLIQKENRSVWIAQREGRTKDGNDATHSGVLKMIAMAAPKNEMIAHLKNLRIVPVSMSYEYDPTDKLKMPQLLAQMQDLEYIKEKNEDFINLMSGVIGQKKRIHIHIGTPLDTEFDEVAQETDNTTKQIQLITKCIDKQIIANYKLWPTNYIAHDLLHNTKTYQNQYDEQEKQLFLRRLEMRVDKSNPLIVQKFLEMYANPVINKNAL
ncbi:1-acyl-sn-glycerol-3-phosphate acyltransferase [Capnocytophaga sp. ARDL2]|uniref:1-acyl-sn-glycerol-3-phosphate acyltransferase n=1 Tax=Capnocytophaga sp. ARDL2 TaxID=3238809 RepID=UPI003556BA2E